MSAVKLVLAILLPPASVFLSEGIGVTLFINILLTLVGWIPVQSTQLGFFQNGLSEQVFSSGKWLRWLTDKTLIGPINIGSHLEFNL